MAFGLGIGIIVTFSKFPHLGCCNQNTPVQQVIVNGQTYQMQTVQRLPNGQLVIVQNPNAGISNPNFVLTPQTVQYTTETTTVQQMVHQPAVVQPVQQQIDLPPSYDKVWDS